MVADVTAAFPGDDATLGRILAATDAGAVLVLDAREVSERLFGDDQSANMLMIGVAYQAGRLPIPAPAVEAAIELNGVAVDRNVQAFRHGRHLVAEGSLTAAADGSPGVAGPGEVADETGLDRLVAARRAELVDYQSEAYAARYEAVVAEVRAAERAATGGVEVSAAVAANLFKLMAYKDEYEVARLALAHSKAQVEAAVGPGATYAWKLHPPTLKALGMSRKVTLGTWFTPAFVALRHLKVLRGTPLDPFGRAGVRRIERELVSEYVDLLRESVRKLDASTYDTVLALAQAPDAVRGYEDVKLANVTAYRARVAGLVDQLGDRRDVRAVR
jgi:indolepyruvate ferredoxin oxidoreductase